MELDWTEARTFTPEDSTCANLLLGNGFAGSVITRKLSRSLHFSCNLAGIPLLAHLRSNMA